MMKSLKTVGWILALLPWASFAQERTGAQLAFDQVFEAKTGPCVAARERINDMGFVEWVAPVEPGKSALVSVMIESQNRTLHFEWKNYPADQKFREIYNWVNFDETTVYSSRHKVTDCATNPAWCKTFLSVQELNLKNLIERNSAYAKAPQCQKDVVLCAKQLVQALRAGLEN